MKQQVQHHAPTHEQWRWPVDIASYDRHPLLYPAEQEELAKLIKHMDGKHNHWPRRAKTTLHRLVSPLEAVFDITDLQGKPRTAVMLSLLRQTYHLHRSFWGWSSHDWLEVLCQNNVEFHQRYRQPAAACRQHMLAVGYLLGGFTDFGSIGRFDQSALAKKVFGPDPVDVAIQQVSDTAARWGYGTSGTQHVLPNALCEVLLANQNPYLEALTLERVDEIRQWKIASYLKSYMVTLSRILVHLVIFTHSLDPLPMEMRWPAFRSSGQSTACAGWTLHHWPLNQGSTTISSRLVAGLQTFTQIFSLRSNGLVRSLLNTSLPPARWLSASG